MAHPLLPFHARRALFTLALTAMLAACAGITPAPDASRLSPPVQRCAAPDSPDDPDRCRDVALDAALTATPIDTGQALLAVAAHEDTSARREALARLALWLQPHPWLPAGGAWSLDALSPLLPETHVRPRDGAILLAPGVAPPGEWPPATPTLRGAPLPMNGAAAWTGPELAILTAAAARADAVLWPSDAAPMLFPATPLINRVIGMEITLPPHALDAARHAARAERALVLGDSIGAIFHARDALGALDDDAFPCRSRGALLFLIRRLGGVAFEDMGKLEHEALRAACFEAQPRDERAAAHLESMVVLLDAVRTFLPEAIDTPQARERYLAQLDARLGPDAPEAMRTRHRALLDFVVAVAPVQACQPNADHERNLAGVRALEALEDHGEVLAGVYTQAAAVFGADHTLQLDRLARWRQALEQPRRRWLRLEGLVHFLGLLRRHAPFDMRQLQAHALCRALVDETVSIIRGDSHPGAPARHAAHLSMFFTKAPVCAHFVDLAPPVDAAFEVALASPDAPMVMLESLGVLMLRGGLLFLGNDPIALSALAQTTSQRLRVIRGQLGDDPSEQALGATIDVVIEVAVSLLNQPSDLTGAVERADATLEALASDPSSPSAILRIAPGLRAIFLELLVIQEMLQDRHDAASKHLARLEPALEPGVLALLQAIDASDQAPALLASIRALNAVAIFAWGTDESEAAREAAYDALRDAVEAPADGWWLFGLAISQALLWDILILADDDPDRANDRESSRKRAFERLEQAAARLPADIALEHPGWGLLPLIPHIHQAFLSYFETEEIEALLTPLRDGNALMLRGLLTQLMQTLSSDAQDDAVIDGPIPMLVALLSALSHTDLEALISGDPVPLVEAARHLLESTSAWPPTDRATMQGVAAAFLLTADENDDAIALLKESLAVASDSDLLRLRPHIPALFALDFAAVLPGDPQVALDLLDLILSVQTQPGACDEHDAVDALLPQRAWLLERLGRHDEADASLARYLTRIDEGFSGNARMRCIVEIQRGHFVGNGTIDLTLSGLLFETPQPQHTFQVGAGWQDYLSPRDQAYCFTFPLPRAFESEVRAQLMRATYALLADDVPTAEAAIDGALSSAAALIHGAYPVLGRDAEGLTEGLRHVDIELIRWVSALARLRGLVVAAYMLDDAADTLRVRRKSIDIEPPTRDPDEPLPIPGPLQHIAHIGALAPLVAATYPPDAQAWQREAVEAAINALPPALRSDDDLRLYLGGLFQRDNSRDALIALLDGVPRPEDPVAAAGHEVLRTVILLTNPGVQANAVLQQTPVVANLLIEQGMTLEVALIVNTVMIALDPSSAPAGELLRFILNAVPPTATWGRLVSLRNAAPTIFHQLDETQQLEVFTALFTQNMGRVPLQEQNALLGPIFNILASNNDLAGLRVAQRRVLDIVIRGSGFKDPTSIQWMVATLALDIVNDAHDPAQLEALAVLAADTPGVDPETLAIIRDFKQSSADREALRAQAERAVRKIFLGGF